tara:strand:- start:2707 stop:3054 length:348 start_codon:yes stop_codon:yes gene_type:complete
MQITNMEELSMSGDDESKSLETKSWEDMNKLEREYFMLHSTHAFNEISEKHRIEDENNTSFLFFALFFYFLSLVMPSIFMLQYMIAGTICLFLQYLVFIGKVGFGRGSSDMGSSD